MFGRSRARVRAVQSLLAAAVLALFVPVVAHASSITILNHDGNPGVVVTAGVPGPFTLTGAPVTNINGQNVVGQLNFKTGAWLGGSLSGDGVTTVQIGSWSAAGSSFTISQQGMGIIFNGSFTSGSVISWLFEGCNTSGGMNSCNYSLSGSITGIYMGQTVSGSTIQLNLTVSCTAPCDARYTGGFGKTFIKDPG